MLVFANLVTRNKDAFFAKVIEISKILDIDPNWLMLVMRMESGINERAINQTGGASGLIQFMPATAIHLGTTIEAIRNMSNLEQLDYVLKYYLPYKGKINSYPDLYLITFYPNARGRHGGTLSEADSYVFGEDVSDSRAKLIATQNPIFDLNKDGYITKKEFVNYILNNKVPGGFDVSTLFKKKASA